MEGAPAGATIDAQGVIAWTPTEAEGPSTNLVTVVVTDDGSPALSASNIFTVVVSEANTAPDAGGWWLTRPSQEFGHPDSDQCGHG